MIDSGAKGMVRELYVDQLYLGGGAEIENTIVSMDDELITEMRPFCPTSSIPVTALHVAVAAPGYIDIQINGACDRQFNDLPDIETVRAIARGARAGGTAYVLPTYTTAPNTDYVVAMQAVEDVVKQANSVFWAYT